VRASATSRAASPANYLASQAKADANKAENDSPFALLVASIAPKDAAKPAIKDASQPQTDSKPAEDQPNPAQDNPTANAPAEPVAAGSASPPSKPEKSGKTKDEVTSKSDKVEGDGTDVDPTIQAGAPWISLNQDGTRYFDYHHTPDDTLDKIDPAQLRQNVAAWTTVLAILSGGIESEPKRRSRR